MVDINTPQRERLRQEYPNVLENIVTDTNLTNEQKEDFFIHIDELHEDGDIESHIKEFCRPLKLCGPVFHTDDAEILGRVHSLNALGKIIAEHQSMSISAAVDLIDSLVIDQELSEQLISQYGDLPISRGIVWGFQHGEPNVDPFEGLNLPDLLCRLGVPEEEVQYLRFSYKLPDDIVAHIPTAFDASTNQYWRPGGYTQPLEECAEIYAAGLVEVVHHPNVIKDLVTEIQKL
ncbi:MAG: hypothetical protein JAY90_20635 [Candidatus Thiodiazotropha lotti]|nr:hypothetical protein [Candidatus Thiodiazotropha lotti]